MSYRIELSESLTELLAGQTRTLGSVLGLRTYSDLGLIKKVNILVSNIDNKFSIGDRNLLKAGMFFQLFVFDEQEALIGGELIRVDPGQDRDTLQLRCFSWERRLDVKASFVNRPKPGNKTNIDLVEDVVKLVYPEGEAQFVTDPTNDPFDNNELLENEHLLRKILDLSLLEGYRFFITSNLVVNFVRNFRDISDIEFEVGRNISNITQEISLDQTFNVITIIGRKTKPRRTQKDLAKNTTNEYIVSRTAPRPSVGTPSIGRRERRFVFPQFTSSAQTQEVADSIVDRLDKITYRFVFDAPFGNYPVGKELKSFSFPEFGIRKSERWTIHHVELISNPNENFARVAIGKRFPAPFDGKIT